jgi:host factor-I protein
MTVELDTGLPSTRLMQNFLREKQTLEIKLTTGDTFIGPMRWQDPLCICVDSGGQAVVLWRSAIAYVKATDGTSSASSPSGASEAPAPEVPLLT